MHALGSGGIYGVFEVSCFAACGAARSLLSPKARTWKSRESKSGGGCDVSTFGRRGLELLIPSKFFVVSALQVNIGSSEAFAQLERRGKTVPPTITVLVFVKNCPVCG
jgi:hypothetical protein